MKFPTWSEFTQKISELQENIQSKVKSFKDDHPVLERALKESFSMLPPPFNVFAEKIYNSVSGSDEEKAEAVVKYLKEIFDQGEDHYNKITLQLENVLSRIDDIQKITAKESTLSIIQEILVSQGHVTEQGLSQLKNDVESMGMKVDEVVDQTATIMRTSDKILSLLEGRDYKAYVDQTGNSIHLKYEGRVVETITAQDLNRLDPGTRRLIGAYEQAMETNFNIFWDVFPQLRTADPMTKARLKEQLRPILDDMCRDMQNIYQYLNRIGKQLSDHYEHIHHTCEKAKADLLGA